ncbi:MAG: amidohydrolase family protein [Bacteroidota bacterium]
MKEKLVIIFAALLIANANTWSQQRILYSRATVHVGNGEKYAQGLVGIEGDEIVLVKNALAHTVDPEKWDTIIECKGNHLYPAFIAPNSTLGLTEIDAVRATRDFDEVGKWNPHVRSLIAFNATSDVSATVKTNGVLYAQATPKGGVISGTSSIVKLEGWNWEDAALKTDDGIHLNWPSTLKGGGWWAEPKPKEKNEKYGEKVTEIEDFFTAAQAYSEGSEEFDARYEAMKAIFQGTKRLYVHANELKALTDILEFVESFEVEFPVIIGGYDAYKIASLLKDAEIPVILKGGHTLPENSDDPIDLPYRLPALLQEKGVQFCIQNSGRMETMNTRNLPFLAGSAMAYGLGEEEAISAVSLNAAKIMGVDHLVGSIEEGKKASFFISEGDALDMRTNNVIDARIQGKPVQLMNHQEELYLKYKKKYKTQGKSNASD